MPQVNTFGFCAPGAEQRGVFFKWAISQAMLVGILLVGAGNPGEGRLSAEELPLSDLDQRFEEKIEKYLNRFCTDCHGEEEPEAGVRLDLLDAQFKEESLGLWKVIKKQLLDGSMPPEESSKPSPQELSEWVDWIDDGLTMAKKRVVPKLGMSRRLTVEQYENTLQQLLGIQDELTASLPPDAPSKDGFLNNQSTLQLSPRLLEAYLEIAQRALEIAIVDEASPPIIQNFRMELGRRINEEPYPKPLILGALSMLLRNEDFRVVELIPEKPFEFTPFQMRTKYRFIEGYRGNDTVRGWREFDSIYHSVFACMRGNGGYPKGRPYEVVPSGLLLRPAIPSAELFQVESTYGPRANFKISLRELPDSGKFRVKVTAAKYADGLLLDPGIPFAFVDCDESAGGELTSKSSVHLIEHSGIYQVDLSSRANGRLEDPPEDSKLVEGLVGHWTFDTPMDGSEEQVSPLLVLEGEAGLVASPWGQGLTVDGKTGSAAATQTDKMDVKDGPFSISAWIHPRELRQGGILCLGGYGYTQGFVFDMPDKRGILRLETARESKQNNGTVQSAPGVIRAGQWQHVAVVCQRGENATRLFVNGYEVAKGTVGNASLSNPAARLMIGRIEAANLFAGEIDEVRFYRRPLTNGELVALFNQGRQVAKPLPPPGPRDVELQLDGRSFTGKARSDGFLTLRLSKGEVEISGKYSAEKGPLDFHLTRLSADHESAKQFLKFEKRHPSLGVHVGLRRDCGSTLNPVGAPQRVESMELKDYFFEGAIGNYPSPNVEKDNVNYLAGFREIGVRSEYSDGRDRPRLLIRSVEFEGPFTESWPPKSHAAIFKGLPSSTLTKAQAWSVVSDFATRAFRRPLITEEAEWLQGVLERRLDSDPSTREAVTSTLAVVLTSPQFLFLIEESRSPEGELLDDWELASKLSYLLWNTAPDEQLLELARMGQLMEELGPQVARMIENSKFVKFATPFASQWLKLDKFKVVEFDRKRFPDLTRDARESLARQPIKTVEYLIRENRPIRELIDADYILADEVVADYYGMGLKTEQGFEFVPVAHGQVGLGGVLTQAAIMAGLSDGRESNPIKRGAWFARAIIAEPPSDPPPNVPELADETNRKLSLREKLELHRNQKGCKNCHEGIDPWGIPFEYYDAGGRLKKGGSVDGASILPDKTTVKNAEEFKDYLVNQRLDQVAFSYLKHLATYAMGRSLTYNEIESIRQMALDFKDRDYPAREMLGRLIESPIFLEK